MVEETHRKKFSNWLQSVLSLNVTKEALHEHVIEKWKKEIKSWKERDQLQQFLKDVAQNKILSSGADANGKKHKKKEWFCDCKHSDCNAILKRVLSLQQNPGFSIVWNSCLCKNLDEGTIKVTLEDEIQTEIIPRADTSVFSLLMKLFAYFSLNFPIERQDNKSVVTINYEDIFDGCKKEHIWCVANMFMQRGTEKTNISNTGPVDTDVAMFFQMMKNCKLFEIENNNDLYNEIILSRGKLHHSANNRISREEANSHLTTMISFLESFDSVPKCVEAIEQIKKTRSETILSVSVPDSHLKKMAEEAYKLKESALNVDKEIERSKGFINEDTDGLLEETKMELENIMDTQSEICYGLKSKEDYKSENQEFKVKNDKIRHDVKELLQENRVLKRQVKKVDGTKDKSISQKMKDPQKHFENMTTLVKAFKNNQEIVEALATEINPLLDEIVEAASESDEILKEKVEEVYEEENAEQQSGKDLDRSKGDSSEIVSHSLPEGNGEVASQTNEQTTVGDTDESKEEESDSYSTCLEDDDIFSSEEDEPGETWTNAATNFTVLEELVNTCETSEKQSADVILLLGKSGAGKSAIINTIHYALTGRYYPIARQGSGQAQYKTECFNRYESCGVSLTNVGDEEKRKEIDKILPKLPHIIDSPGLYDKMNIREHSEILELVIKGYIPPGTQLSALQKWQKDYGAGCLSTMFTKSNPGWKVTKLAIVQSCMEQIPKNLLECLQGVLKIIDPVNLYRQCIHVQDVFLLITKSDILDEQVSSANNAELVTPSTVENVEIYKDLTKQIETEVNSDRELKVKAFSWLNYTDSSGTVEDPKITSHVLKFIKCVVETGEEDTN